ncbi:MAG: SDR family NAD(P)-dependent oxidoreductase [Planctomycetes bacterium]|nr:SDR family NAD(P)-dependent oxidoreductase [Planctomycetota bacterium]
MAETDIAVVGMACRLPGAPDLDAFWRLLREGRDARVELADEHLRNLGVSAEALADPDYVKAAMVLDGIDQFDAGFFGLSPRDAALFDPQHRVFLECTWEAFEHAGHVPERFDGRIGVFAGCGMDTYLLHNILTNPDLVRRVGMFLIRHTGNDKDFLATRVSYQFDLRGPSVNVLTACSTSLVAIHQAAHSLLAGECDMAVAGGVTILVPQDRGYHYKEGEVLSPDGHCRTFDADSKGTIFGSGAGVVVLRRLADALASGDKIHAVVAGSAVNNDGARKVSYLAPSVDGYAEVVAEALALADVPADHVQYVEAHGTGTSVGDPIEIEALTQAFRASTGKKGYCGIGSVKTNIGHLDTAAGVAGFLKVVLAMQHGEIPASLNYRRPNPLIDFPNSPFHVVAAPRAWPRLPTVPRIGGVSSLGVGGTNAHVIVREATAQPEPANTAWPRRCHLVPVSGKVEGAALGNAKALAARLRGTVDADLPDVAWTLQTGRRAFPVRGFAVGANGQELAAQLEAPEWKAQLKKAPDRAPSLVFLFPGGGAQYPGMGRELYAQEAVFRAAVDDCLRAIPAKAQDTVRRLLLGDLATPEHGARFEQPSVMLPGLFTIEYALAKLLASWGIVPDAMTGHSLGEYVAATLGGTFTLAQVLPLLVRRGELFEEVQGGVVLSVSLSAEQVHALGHADLSLTAANAPNLCAVAGDAAAIARFEQDLQQRGVEYQRLRIGVAAHSHLLDPILDRYRDVLRALRLQPAQKPWVSNVTGDWIDPQRAADPDYWVEHSRRTVRFQDGIATLLAAGDRVFLEVGPGKALTSLARLHARAAKSPCIVSMPHAKDTKPSDTVALETVGRLWQLGVAVDWLALHGGTPRRRVPLPTYAFQRQRHWIDAGAVVAQEGVLRSDAEPVAPSRLPESEWLRRPVFRAQELAPRIAAPAPMRWLCIGGGAFTDAFAAAVRAGGGSAVVLREGAEARAGQDFVLPLDDGAAIDRVLRQLPADAAPQRLLFALPLEAAPAVRLVRCLLAVWQALGRADLAAKVRCLAVTVGAARVATEAMANPEQATVGGFLRVVPREYEGARTRCVDVDAAALAEPAVLVAALRREIESDDLPLLVALRGAQRFVQELAAVEADANRPVAPWRPQGVYLLSGGLGGIGLVLADHLAQQAQAKLVLLGRRGLPPRELWDEWLRQRTGDRIAGLVQRVRELERRGAEVHVAAADVTDRAAIDRVVREARTRFGALHGVVHTAGVLDDGLIQSRAPERSERMLAPKLLGAQVLDAATADHPPELFVVFGSTSGLAGIPGQCDYAAANAALDAFATWRSGARPGRSLAIDWGIWQDVGMLAASAAAHAQPAAAWLGTRSERDGAVEFAASWSPATHWQLAEHRVKGGDCVMPGTGHVELMVAAVQAVAQADEVSLQRVEFLTPLAFPGAAARDVFVTVRALRDGFEVAVASAPVGETDPHARATHARARAVPAGAREDLVDLAALRARITQPAPATSDQDRHVDFGPRWRCIERVAVADGQALAELQLPPQFAADLDQHRVHAAMLDMAFGVGIRLLSGGAEDALFVPVGCDRVAVSGRFPARVVTHVEVKNHDAHARLGALDVTVTTETGIVLLELRGLQLFGVRGGFARADAKAAPAAAAPTVGHNGHVPAAAPVPRIRALLGRGITGPEGMAALDRALRTDAPQVVASSLDVARTAAWLSLPPEKPKVAAAAATAAPAGAANADDAPRDDVERKLVDGYRELLGVDHPGLDQDFFELGGHSLLAVRLFARIHKDFGLDLELATLLQAGTVRKLAAVVRTELKLPEPGSEPARSVAARRGQHVVPIQTAGGRPKLFLVHGAGGNVLGFRELSHYFGKDQPLYGLQARGVDGKQRPLETITEMATAYLAELREVQPHGPYFLGGYSGGGVVAYEMAQQLLRQGELVAYIGMIDSWCPQMKRRGKVARALLHAGRVVKRGPMYPVNILRMKLERRRSARESSTALRPDGVMPQEMRGLDVQFAFERAFESHVVQSYEGKVWLYRCTEHDLGTRYVFEEHLGWQPFVRGGMSIVQCPGNHYSMCTEPNVQVLCRHMMAGVDEAMAAVGLSATT